MCATSAGFIPSAPPENGRDPFTNVEQESPRGRLIERSVQPLQTDESNETRACDWKVGLTWTGIAFAILSFVAGLIGALVYSGAIHLSIGGAVMSEAAAFYILLSGFGISFILTTLLVVACVVQRARETKPGEQKPWCASICGKYNQQQNSSGSESMSFSSPEKI